MLPSLSALIADLDQLLIYYIRDKSRAADPILQSPSTDQHEGEKRYFEDEDGTRRYFEYKRNESPISIPANEFSRLTLPQLFEKCDAMAEDLARQMARHAYHKLSESTSASGTAVNAGGQAYSVELELETLATMNIEFDEDVSRPIWPVTIAPPELKDVISRKKQEWIAVPGNAARLGAFVRTKYEQWRAREDRRKLVD
jgi:hypothetical protein